MIARLRAGMGAWLMALAVAASLPLFLFAAYLVHEFETMQRADTLTELLQRTEATANAVHGRLGIALGLANALATSEAALRNDLPALYEHARRVAQHDVRAVSLIAPDGSMVFLTLRPFGTKGLPVGDLATAKHVFATGKPAVSGPFVSPISDAIVTTVGVPVFRDGQVVYCLRMVLLTASLNELLAQQKLPAEWTSRIIDADGRVVARSRSPERYVGKRASPDIVGALRAGSRGVFDVVTQEGVAGKATIAKVPSWDWQVVVDVPTATLNASRERSLALLATFGIASALVFAAVAFGLSRFIARHVHDVVAAADALHRGEAPTLSHAPVRELDQMARAIEAVAVRERRTQVALSDAAAQHRKVSAELESARRDALTGLPLRALFLETAEDLRERAAAQGGVGLAFLFVDLDGFKQVNDAYGHDQGDKVLVQTAGILRTLTRGSDVSGRLGGDEFVVCLAADQGQLGPTAAGVAARVVERVGAIGFGIGCSIGIAVWPDECPDASCALSLADEAMYEAKRLGKNRWVVFGAAPKADGTAWGALAPQRCPVRCVA